MLPYADTGEGDGNPAYQEAGVHRGARKCGGVASEGAGAAEYGARDWLLR